ncbi:MAG TPA: hypothetical protein VFB78_02120 [Acidimicrobiales bacterium]|nr:hypothetical protein [Acidimicrobiales bacterium]
MSERRSRYAYSLLAALVATTSWVAMVPRAGAASAALPLTVGPPISVATPTLDGISCVTALDCQAVGADAVQVIDRRPTTVAAVPAADLSAVACPMSGSCIAVGHDATGGVVVPITGGAPGAVVAVPGAKDLRGVACISATACFAVGTNAGAVGVVVPVTAGTPGTAVPVPNVATLNAVACAGAVCEAVGNGLVAGVLPTGAAVSINGGVVGRMAPVLGTTELNAVACRAAASCVAVGALRTGIPVGILCVGVCVFDDTLDFGTVARIDGGLVGLARPVLSAHELNGVACPSAAPAETPCLAVGVSAHGPYGMVLPVGGRTHARPTVLRFTSNALNAISCGALECEAVVAASGAAGVVAIAFGPLAGGRSVDSGFLDAAACATDSACFAGGTDRESLRGVLISVRNGTASRIPVVSPWIRGLACASPTLCYAGSFVYVQGRLVSAIVPIRNGRAGPPIPINDFALSAIACASSTSCVAVGSSAQNPVTAAVVPIVNGTPGAVSAVPTARVLHGVACPTATRCEAAGEAPDGSGFSRALVTITNGVAAPATLVAGPSPFRTIGCPSATVCYASTGPRLVTITSGVPGPDVLPPIGVGPIACPSATTCVLGGFNAGAGAFVTLTGGVFGTPMPMPAFAYVTGLGCGPTRCLAVGSANGYGVVQMFSP